MMVKRTQLFRRCAVTAAAFLLMLCCAPVVLAEAKTEVSLTASERTVHSGGQITLTAKLSSPLSEDVGIVVSDGRRTLEVPVAAGEASGTLTFAADTCAQTTRFRYAVQKEESYSAGKGTTVTVLPSPSLAFSGKIGVASAGKTMKVRMLCKNASQMTVPLPVSLRSEDGTVLDSFTFDPLNTACQSEIPSPDAAGFSHCLYLYNDVTGKACARMPVAVFAPKRPGIRRVEAKGKIALGFDCGYGNQYTEYIMDMLDEFDAKATFFVTGFFVKDYPEMLGKMRDRGFEIGNHTMTHPYLGKMENLSDIYGEIEGVNRGVYEAAGIRPRVMRPPYGSCSVDAAAVSRMAGCEVVFWTMDPYDWDPQLPAEKIISRATENIGEGCIMLFHNNAPKTEQTLRTILEDYRAKGLEIVSVSELLYPAHYTVDKDGLQRLDPAYEMIAPSVFLEGLSLKTPVEGKNETVTLRAAVTDDTPLCRRKEDVKLLREHPEQWDIRYSFGDALPLPAGSGSVGTAAFVYEGEEWFTAVLSADGEKEAAQKEAPTGSGNLVPLLCLSGAAVAVASGAWLLAGRMNQRRKKNAG